MTGAERSEHARRVRVAAVVVNFNGARDLPACVRALQAQTHPLEQVVVVDNASTDGSAQVLTELRARRHPVPVRVVHNTANRGFAGGANDGVRAAGDVDAVLVANPDAVAADDFVAHAVDALMAAPDRGAVQGRLHRREGTPGGLPVIDTTGHVAGRPRLFRNRGEGEVDRGQWDEPGPVFGVSGALALYRRAMLEDVAIEVRRGDGTTRHEVFDEDLFAFWEDVDLDWRAAMRGWTCWYEPGAVATHERGGAGPRRTSDVERLNFRNRLLLLVKDDTWRALAPVLVAVVATTLVKLVELAVTNPSAAVGVVADLRLVPVMRAKRAAVHGAATVPSADVVAWWFEPFGYRAWIRSWWRRVRGVPVGHEPPMWGPGG